MNLLDYLKTQQPTVYRTFSQSLFRGKLSHAYLLSGQRGVPLLDIAKLFAQSLVCENPSPLADTTCLHCIRVMDGTYGDLIVYDAQTESIKRDDLHSLTDSFEMTPIEPAGKLIYIINLIENVLPENVNSLLKFLEEPTQEVYAFLTTENEARVLPTIVSRTQVLRFKEADLTKIIKEAENLGVAQDDAEILAHFHHDPDAIKAMVINEDYIALKRLIVDFLILIPDHRNQAKLYWLTNVIETVEDKEKARFFLDLLSIFLEAILKRSKGQSNDLSSYDKLLMSLSIVLPHLEKTTMEIMLTRGQIELNVSIALLLEHVLTTIGLEE